MVLNWLQHIVSCRGVYDYYRVQGIRKLDSNKNLKGSEKIKSSNMVKQKTAMYAVPKSGLCFGLAPLLHGDLVNFLSKTDAFFQRFSVITPSFYAYCTLSIIIFLFPEFTKLRIGGTHIELRS